MASTKNIEESAAYIVSNIMLSIENDLEKFRETMIKDIYHVQRITLEHNGTKQMITLRGSLIDRRFEGLYNIWNVTLDWSSNKNNPINVCSLELPMFEYIYRSLARVLIANFDEIFNNK